VGEDARVVDVVAWTRAGDRILRVPSLQQLEITLDDELAIAKLLSEIQARVGLSVALVDLTDSHLHVELLESRPALTGWCEPDIEITGRAAWNELGWYADTSAMLDETLTAHGITRAGPFVQRKHWSISAILSVSTDAGELWFKQVPAFMAHEGRVVQWLSRLRSGCVPDVVDLGSDWCLTRPFPAPSDEPGLDSPFGLLAELRQLATDRVDELLELGCPDRRSAQLLRDLEALRAREDVIEPEQRRALADALPALADRCARLDDGPIRPTIVHGDLHSGNWTRTDAQDWIIFDWTDACVAHPFIDLGVVTTKNDAVRAARLRAYVDAWRPYDPDVESTLADALPVAAAHHAISYQRIVDNVSRGDAPSWHPAVRHHLDQLLRHLAS
jgi:hypothetical protein